MIINKTDYCGLADAIMAQASTAYAIVHYDCATGYYSFAHELGHCKELATIRRTTRQPRPTPTGTASSISLRRRRGGPSWRMIALADALGCSIGPIRTSSTLAMGTATTNDNARVLNGTASTVAAFRTDTPLQARAYLAIHRRRLQRRVCPGWQLLDNNAATVRISASSRHLYQLHNSGRIWRSTGAACSGESARAGRCSTTTLPLSALLLPTTSTSFIAAAGSGASRVPPAR